MATLFFLLIIFLGIALPFTACSNEPCWRLWSNPIHHSFLYKCYAIWHSFPKTLKYYQLFAELSKIHLVCCRSCSPQLAAAHAEQDKPQSISQRVFAFPQGHQVCLQAPRLQCELLCHGNPARNTQYNALGIFSWGQQLGTRYRQGVNRALENSM